ncbi:MAG: tetratricopeptide repeat-containing protein [Rhodospirillales bacterium]
MDAAAMGRAFVVMPFGRKRDAAGEEIDFDLVYAELIAPALLAAGLQPFRADAETRAGSIHADMFQELLLADLVVADLSIDNPNAFYELGVRHALRDNATVSIFSRQRPWLPFDIIGERSLIYTPLRAPVDRGVVEADRHRLTEMIGATLAAWRGRKTSPVYRMLPNLEEPQWKNLKVGDINEFWQKLENWQSWVTTAVNKQRPGDILLLADEPPNRIVEIEAVQTAAKALLQLNSLRYALVILERGLALDPDNLWFRQNQGLAFGRSGRFADARARLTAVAARHPSGESLGLLGRCYKDQWLRLWRGRKRDGLAAPEVGRQKATAAAAHLERAFESYAHAFRSDPKDWYPGINALTLGSLWHHLTGRVSARADLALITQGVRWTVACSLDACEIACRSEYWPLVTRAELRLVADNDEGCLDDYRAAAAQAVIDSNRFALASTAEQLEMMIDLDFRADIAAKARAEITAAERQLADLLGSRLETPRRTVLFSGHMIDDPARRGAGQVLPERFPAHKVDAAKQAIEAALDGIGAGEGDLGLCGGACGGDLLFAEACLARGMNLDIRLARRVPQYLAESVTFADPDQTWFRLYHRVATDPRTSVLVMPEEVGPAPEGVSVHDRNNRWQLYSALSQELDNVHFVALWDGNPAGGPGGTEEMVRQIRTLTGRAPIIIDPGAL